MTSLPGLSLLLSTYRFPARNPASFICALPVVASPRLGPSRSYVRPSADLSTTVTAMKGGTSTLAGEILPPLPVNSACVEIGSSSPDCSSLEDLVERDVTLWAVVVVLTIDPMDADTVDEVVTAAAVVDVVVAPPPPPPPPPHPASTTRAAATSSALKRMGLSRLEDHDLRRGLRLDVRLERLVVGLDRREGVVVDRDHRVGADPVGGGHRVVPVHRVVAADRDERDVDVVARLHELEVAEQPGVAHVVDGLAAEVDHEAGRDRDRATRGGRGVPRRHKPDPAAVELHGAADVRVGDVLDSLLLKLVRDLDDRHAVGARALRDVLDVPVVIAVTVGEEDVCRVQLGGLDGGHRIAADEGIHEHDRVPLGELYGRVAQEANVHRSVSFAVVFVKAL